MNNKILILIAILLVITGLWLAPSLLSKKKEKEDSANYSDIGGENTGNTSGVPAGVSVPASFPYQSPIWNGLAGKAKKTIKIGQSIVNLSLALNGSNDRISVDGIWGGGSLNATRAMATRAAAAMKQNEKFITWDAYLKYFDRGFYEKQGLIYVWGKPNGNYIEYCFQDNSQPIASTGNGYNSATVIGGTNGGGMNGSGMNGLNNGANGDSVFPV